MSKELTSREVIGKVYDFFKYKLEERFSLEKEIKEVKLDPVAQVEVADDSDWHRTKKGYMVYNKALVWKKSDWQAIALGNPRGAYPIRPYAGELVASIELEGDDEKEVRRSLEKHNYFRQSLLVVHKNGLFSLGITPEQLFNKELKERKKKIKKVLKEPVDEFIAQDLEVDEEHITLNLTRPIKQVMKYKPEMADYIFEKLTAILFEK